MSIDTDRFRTLLLDERERIERAIANLREDHPGRLDDEVEEISATQDNHLAETATVTLDREIDYTLEENSTRMLAAIDASLQRLDDGTYGTCSACNREIAEQRLEAYPWASLCIDCKREAERR
ncbi:MAG TPA: TraR/DksA C4-type zinc finger protein [Gaiellaceae bacterium]|nr:TraR/DksA C4-type zinc finger protein [Gaiellaceae bacterium]